MPLECSCGSCIIKQDEYNNDVKFKYRKDRYKAGAFIYDSKNDKILLVQSRGKLWGPPKGSLEVSKNETFEECAIREVIEETGIVLTTDKFKDCIKIRGRAVYFYTPYSLCEIEVQRTCDNDANGICWISPYCLKELIRENKMGINNHCKILLRKILEVII